MQDISSLVIEVDQQYVVVGVPLREEQLGIVGIHKQTVTFVTFFFKHRPLKHIHNCIIFSRGLPISRLIHSSGRYTIHSHSLHLNN